MPSISIPGLSPTGKVPGAFVNVRLGQGPVKVGQIPRYLLIVGTMLAADDASVSTTATPDQDVVDISPTSDLNLLFGDRSEIAQGIRAALQVPGIKIKAAPVAEASGAAAATMTITFATDASSDGTWVFYVAGTKVEVNVSSGDTPTEQATAAVAAFNAKPFTPCFATSSSGVVTLTIRSKGTGGNNWTVYKDQSAKPGGTTCVLATASSYSVEPGPNGETGVRFGGGTGTPDVTNVLGVLQTATYFTIAAGQNDATNAGLYRAYLRAKAAIGTQRYEHAVFAVNGLETTADSLADSTLNDPRCQVVWLRGAENHPIQIAAAMAALRTQKEQAHPNRRYNGDVLLGLTPQRALVDRPTPGDTGEQATRLDNGVTPLTTTDDGQVQVVRSITTYCRKNGIAFTGCIDSGQARAPDTAAEMLTLAWLTEFSVKNEWVNDDPADGEKARPEGVATPRIWKAYAKGLLDGKIQENWFSSVDVSAEYDADTRQLLTQIAVEVTPQNHRVGVNLDQVT